jgi:hypothetical protein
MPDTHPFELFLQLEQIEHRSTPVRRPQTNGIGKRLRRTLLDEHFRIQGPVTLCQYLEERRENRDNYLRAPNYGRALQEPNMNGKNPYTVFIEGIPDSLPKEAQPPYYLRHSDAGVR